MRPCPLPLTLDHPAVGGLPAAGTCGSPENFLVSGTPAARVHRQAPVLQCAVNGHRDTRPIALLSLSLSLTDPVDWALGVPRDNLEPPFLSAFSLLSCFSGKRLFSGITSQVTTCPYIFMSGWLLGEQAQHRVCTKPCSDERLFSSPGRGKEEGRKKEASKDVGRGFIGRGG